MSEVRLALALFLGAIGLGQYFTHRGGPPRVPLVAPAGRPDLCAGDTESASSSTSVPHIGFAPPAARLA